MEKFLKYIASEVEIEKGDLVCYLTTTTDKTSKYPKTIHVPLFGIWDGEKVECWDKERTTVRGKHMLTKCELYVCSKDKNGKEKLIYQLSQGTNLNKINISKELFTNKQAV